MSSHYPFLRVASLAAFAAAAVALVQPVGAQTAQQAALSGSLKAEAPRPEAPRPPENATAAAAHPGNAAPVDQGNPAQKGIATKAIEKAREVAKSAGDIFARVPCQGPKGVAKSMGSLPHVAKKLVDGQPVLIIAFGSSSTQGYGSSAPEYTYPNRLLAQLKRNYPTADITVLNRGKGGEDAPEMMRRLQTEVIDMKPDLVIWQVGTNALLRNLDQGETAKLVEDGVARIQAAGSDVVLVDPQYSPRVNEKAEGASKMIKVLNRVAELRKVGIFPRFEVMRDWHEKQSIPIDTFVISDGLHMNDWGYACFAQLLGDDIIKSVGAIKLGVAVPSDVRTYRPM
ncbi:SGNH/GDSL hydrolase family protein [Bradyrhizobium lablabi]|uniref:SGNH/GDSL hydrolase family protein n=1 Tax=Bradyrhizobium lablabi TaxID=722472 RepID=UPI001BAB2DFF|nr:SGNH/GDSL hydrolase family protein [Bradyrhizobium lablabi]MBR1123664.1 SGNH/GDSL hydrolase family protein [Bradyrhizobium lablabi]